MHKGLSADVVKQESDWRDLYLEHGQEMLDLAKDLLASSDGKDVDLGLKIVEGAYFEEDEENPDAEPSLAHLDFDGLIEPLASLEKDAAYSKRAKHCLAIIKLEKGEKDPVDLDAALENLEAKSDAKNRKAVEELLELAKDGVDIAPALPVIMEREEKLAMATDAMQVLVVYYIRQDKLDDLEALFKRDEAGSVRIYRGLTGAMMNGFDAKAFLDRPGVMDRLREISSAGRMMSIDSVIAGDY